MHGSGESSTGVYEYYDTTTYIYIESRNFDTAGVPGGLVGYPRAY